MHLAGVDRIAVEPVDLRTLDLAIPIRALHQPHHQPVPTAPGEVDEIVDDERTALLVSLYHEADAVPALESRVEAQGFEQVERELQPVGFFGVDIDAHVVAPRQFDQGGQAGQQFIHHPCVLGPGVAGMQRGEFDRKPWPFEDAAAVRGLADGMQGLFISGEVTLRVGLGDRRLAQHVVGVAKALFLLRTAVGQRFRNGLPGDELLAHQPHGALHALADQRFAPLADEPRQRAGQPFFTGGCRQSAGQHQPPNGRVDEYRRRVTEMRLPVAPTDLVAYQGIAGGVVGDAQQRLGQTHQRHAFLAGERKLLHQGLHAAHFAPRPHAFDQPLGHLPDGRALGGVWNLRQLDQHGQTFRLRPMPGCGDGRAQIGLRQHVLRPVEKGSGKGGGKGGGIGCTFRLVVRGAGLRRFFGRTQRVKRKLATLDVFHHVQRGLLDQPVRCTPQPICGEPHPLAQGFVHFDTGCGCAHFYSFRVMGCNYWS